jgi:hypothetical protein
MSVIEIPTSYKIKINVIYFFKQYTRITHTVGKQIWKGSDDGV